MVHSGYHPLKYPLPMIVLEWCTVDIILLRIVVLEDSAWIGGQSDRINSIRGTVDHVTSDH